MNRHDYKITVFTPTYNRVDTLKRLYTSLQKQTFKDFEWLVIDDGSSDKTSSLVEKWISESNPFPIHYYFKKNGGKHTAINYGLDKAKGALFFTADSDDYLTADALYKVSRWVDSLPQSGKFCGVVGNWGHSTEKTPNTIFKGEWRDANLLERYPDYSASPIDGERAFVFFTEIHRKYKYPEYEDEKFMTEAVTWNRMANDGYKMRIFNDIIYIYKYLPDGLTWLGYEIFFDNPKGYGIWLREKAKFCNYSFYRMLQMYYGYFFTQKNKLSVKEIADNIGAPSWLILFLSYWSSFKRFYRRI